MSRSNLSWCALRRRPWQLRRRTPPCCSPRRTAAAQSTSCSQTPWPVPAPASAMRMHRAMGQVRSGCHLWFHHSLDEALAVTADSHKMS